MNKELVIDLLLEATTLKRMPRTGWLMRGVPHVESVAEHSFGVAFLVLALADALATDADAPVELDVEKALAISLLHDLAEVRLTDLPASAARLLPDAAKSQAEASAIRDLLAPLQAGNRLGSWWQEFEDSSSAEGRLVRDADKLEMMIQCLRYEQAGSRGLNEFWQALDQRRWHYRQCAELYGQLKVMRPMDGRDDLLTHE
jgi:putative hydrolase of HD superfamily